MYEGVQRYIGDCLQGKMQYKDYYEVLGVPKDVTGEALKKAFRKLARKFHPDVSREADAEARMREVNEAYAVLSDPEKRAAYDQLGQGHHPGQDFRPPPDWDAGFEFSGKPYTPHDTADFSDFFSELFGGIGGRQQRGPGRSASAGRGEDHHAKVLLDLEDAFTGATRQISLRVPKLDAQGRVVLETRTLNVKIPQGVHAGQIIRLTGQGAPGYAGDPAGDLLLEVQFRPHPRMRAEGRDVYLSLPITPWEAALGAVVSVDLPQGALQIRLPAGVRRNRNLRVRGKGLPGNPPGDLILELQIVLPPADSAEAKEIYETMARSLSFDPRKETKD